MKNLLKIALVFALAAGVTACKKNIKDDASGDMTITPGNTEMYLEETVVVDVVAVEVAVAPVFFDLDKYNLTAENRKAIEANAKAIKARVGNSTFKVVVEGNCDERGTIAYNIALGEKRASEVKAYYVRLGIAATNINTVSYGKEKPICYDSTQTCWARNRRADTIIAIQ